MQSGFRFGSFELDCVTGELRKAGIRIALEDQPFRLLAALLARPGEVLTREELRSALWTDDTFVEFDRSLTRAINKVRTALGDAAANPRFIETLPRRGYRFVAPVSVMPSEPAPPLPPPEGRKQWNLGLAVVILIAAIGGATAFVKFRLPAPMSAVAVLPFENLSGDPANNYFADAMTEHLIGALSRNRSLRVVSRTSAMHYKGTRRKLADVAQDLRVDAVVEGSVALSAGRVQVNARLIRLPGEQTVWTKTYEREAADILKLQVELARNIAREAGAFITPEEESRLARIERTVDPELHALYSQGRLFVNEPGRDAIERGIHALEQVIAKDPTHAPAWTAISDGWFSMSSVYLPPMEAMPKAKAAARRALDLDPESDAAHAALGRIHVFYDWNWKAGGEQLQKALDLNPNSSAAYRGLAFLRLAEGRMDESQQAIDRAIQLDPMSLWANFQSVMTLTCARRYDEAARQARRTLDWEPRFGFMRSALGLVHAEKGDFVQSVKELEMTVETQKVPTTLAFLAQGYAMANRKQDAERVMADLVALANRQYVCPFEVASAFAVLGRTDEAFAWMNKALADRADCMIWLRAEPWLKEIRRDARYAQLVRSVGFQ